MTSQSSFTSHLSRRPLALTVAKFKIRQYVLGNDLPNLMLAKVLRYTVYLEYEYHDHMSAHWNYRRHPLAIIMLLPRRNLVF